MGDVYVLDAFSPNMLGKFPTKMIIDKLTKDEFCEKVHVYSQTGDLKVALGRESSAKIINALCGTQLEKNKTRITLNEGDKALVMLTKVRLNEEKPPKDDEIKRMYKEGKIELYEVIL
jgi:ribosomal protein L6P/L9E